jgi:beta-lactamase class A
MSIFATKEEEEFEEVEDRALTRKKIKDLKPENTKKRKEPPKPWGKKERYIVLATLGATILLSLLLAASARSWKLPNLPAISLPSFKEETIMITGKAQDKQMAEDTIISFRDKTNSLSGVYAFYVIRLDSGFSYGASEAKTMQAASLIKLPVFAALYKEAEEGKIDLDAKYTLKASDKIAGAGNLASKPEGTAISYRELARLMGKQSDNTAFGIIRRLLGEPKINTEISEIGMESTSLEKNETTPYDIGLFFQKLWEGKIVSEKYKEEILDYLTDTIYEDWMAAGIPSGIRVAHKYGREIHVVNDAGIVYTDKPFVLVLLSQGVVEKEADIIFPELARFIYQAETQK